MRYVVAGASGFLGRALCADLVGAGHEVTRLVRRPARTPDESRWDPPRGQVDATALRDADVVVNLSGATIGRPWTSAYRETIRRSRVDTTATLAEAVAGLAADSRPPVFVNQSASGYYAKDQDTQVLDEDAPSGTEFLPQLVGAWEEATVPAADAGARVVRLRTALVLHRSGGALAPMLVPFRLGLGGQLGSGQQYMPVVGLRDWLRAVRFVAENDEPAGVYNVTIPTPPTNAEFTKALGAALGRPTVLRVPAAALRLALGGMSVELLGSIRVVPRRLLDAGFEFTAPDVDAVVRAALEQSP